MPTALISRAGNAAKAGSKKFSSAWSGTNHERPRDPGDLSRRNGAHLPHADAEDRLAGTVDLAVLRGVRRGDRLARRRHRRYQLWRIHHSRTGDAVAAYREHFQRLVRHLHAEILRSEEHTSELQSLMRISYAVFCLKKKKTPNQPALIDLISTPEHENN